MVHLAKSNGGRCLVDEKFLLGSALLWLQVFFVHHMHLVWMKMLSGWFAEMLNVLVLPRGHPFLYHSKKISFHKVVGLDLDECNEKGTGLRLDS